MLSSNDNYVLTELPRAKAFKQECKTNSMVPTGPWSPRKPLIHTVYKLCILSPFETGSSWNHHHLRIAENLFVLRAVAAVVSRLWKLYSSEQIGSGRNMYVSGCVMQNLLHCTGTHKHGDAQIAFTLMWLLTTHSLAKVTWILYCNTWNVYLWYLCFSTFCLLGTAVRLTAGSWKVWIFMPSSSANHEIGRVKVSST